MDPPPEGLTASSHWRNRGRSCVQPLRCRGHMLHGAGDPHTTSASCRNTRFGKDTLLVSEHRKTLIGAQGADQHLEGSSSWVTSRVPGAQVLQDGVDAPRAHVMPEAGHRCCALHAHTPVQCGKSVRGLYLLSDGKALTSTMKHMR